MHSSNFWINQDLQQALPQPWNRTKMERVQRELFLQTQPNLDQWKGVSRPPPNRQIDPVNFEIPRATYQTTSPQKHGQPQGLDSIPARRPSKDYDTVSVSSVSGVSKVRDSSSRASRTPDMKKSRPSVELPASRQAKTPQRTTEPANTKFIKQSAKKNWNFLDTQEVQKSPNQQKTNSKSPMRHTPRKLL